MRPEFESTKRIGIRWLISSEQGSVAPIAWHPSETRHKLTTL
jgi:hypothetical protein